MDPGEAPESGGPEDAGERDLDMFADDFAGRGHCDLVPEFTFLFPLHSVIPEHNLPNTRALAQESDVRAYKAKT